MQEQNYLFEQFLFQSISLLSKISLPQKKDFEMMEDYNRKKLISDVRESQKNEMLQKYLSNHIIKFP